MSVKLLDEHHLEFLSFEGGCARSSESTLFKMPHCWKSHVVAQIFAANGRHFNSSHARDPNSLAIEDLT